MLDPTASTAPDGGPDGADRTSGPSPWLWPSGANTGTRPPAEPPVAPPLAGPGQPAMPWVPLEVATAPVPPAPSEPSRGRRSLKIAAVVVALLALVGVGVGIGIALDEDPATDATPAVASASGTADTDAGAAAAPAPADDPATTTDTPAEPVELADVPGPADAEAPEPVAEVNRVLAAAVVRIDTAGGTGSGIFYDDSGLLVTNAHVVVGFDEVSVQLADGTRVDGAVLGVDPSVDVAVVRIDPDAGEFAVATFAPTSSVEVGQLAVAIGSPFGLEQSVTAGIVSAVNRVVTNTSVVDGSPTIVEMVQTDAPINPGNSGGALADRQGRVIGMNTSIRTDGGAGNLGVGFAIPSDTVILVANRIVDGTTAANGFLGVSGQDPVVGRPGALVTDVVAGGPAEAGGLRSGDLITGFNGEDVAGMAELAAKVRINPPGTVVTLDVERNGEAIEVPVELGELSQS